MKPVSDVDRILLAMRGQALSSTQSAKRARAVSKETSTQSAAGRVRRPADDLIARIRSIDHQEPQYARRVFRAFLDSKAAAMFGTEALGDATFQAMLDKVHRAMEQDVELTDVLDRTSALMVQLAAPDGTRLEALHAELHRVLSSGPS